MSQHQKIRDTKNLNYASCQYYQFVFAANICENVGELSFFHNSERSFSDEESYVRIRVFSNIILFIARIVNGAQKGMMTL